MPKPDADRTAGSRSLALWHGVRGQPNASARGKSRSKIKSRWRLDAERKASPGLCVMARHDESGGHIEILAPLRLVGEEPRCGPRPARPRRRFRDVSWFPSCDIRLSF